MQKNNLSFGMQTQTSVIFFFLDGRFLDGCLVLSNLCGLLQNVSTGQDSCLTLQAAFGTIAYDDHMHF